MQARVLTASPLPVPPSWTPGHAEIVFTGVEQAGPSFEGRVFLNNPHADGRTALEPAAGYAGSFHVYGYGAAAPPAMVEARKAQGEGYRPVAPIDKRLRADVAAVRAALERSDQLTVTVVAVPADPDADAPARPFEDVQVVFDRAT